MKNLLVVLDESPQGRVAGHLAIDTATRHGFSVTGLSLLDTGAILHAETSSYRGAGDDDSPPVVGLAEARQQRGELVEAFRRSCGDAGIQHSIVEHEGEPFEFLDKEDEAHDLVILGKGSNFALHPETELEETVTRLLRKSSRPLVLAPVEDSRGEDIVVAYDGSPPAARALQMLVLLGLASGGGTVHLTSVASSVADAEEVSDRAAAYLAAHDVRVERHNIDDSGHPADAILARILDLKPSLLAMGAYGHRGWREVLMGSSTIKLLNYATIPVFVHH